MKNKVIEFFQNLPENKPEQFNKAFELYRQSPGKIDSTERVLNATGFSESSLNNLLYDLQKMHGITDIEKIPVETKVEDPDFRLAILDKVIELTPLAFPDFLDVLKEFNLTIDELIELANSTENDLAILKLTEIDEFTNNIKFLDYLADRILDEILKEFGENTPSLEDLEKVLEFAISQNHEKAVERLNEIIAIVKTPGTEADLKIVKDDSLINENEDLKNKNEELTFENEDLQDENEELKGQLEKAQALPKISAESLRVEFAFLNEKECPNELKILVADKITAWNEYLVLQDEISKAEAGEITLTKDELELKGKRSVECFTENQKIYEELNAYKETGKVLGKHPIFRTLRLSREVETMTNEQLINYKNSTAKFFSVNKANLKKAEKTKDLSKIEALNLKIEERTEKLELVNKKLGV